MKVEVRITLLIPFLALFCLTSVFCISSTSTKSTNPSNTTTITSITTKAKPIKSKTIRETFPEQFTQFTNGCNDFGFKLSRKVIGTEDNILISPISMYFVLGMVYVGSTGKTSREVRKALRLHKTHMKNELIHKHLHEFLTNLMQLRTKPTQDMGNGMFVQDYMENKVTRNYSDTLAKVYLADEKRVNFTNNVETTKIISDFIVNRTHDSLNDHENYPKVVMTLLNAYFFENEWNTTFPVKDITDATFYRQSKPEKVVKFMGIRKVTLPFYNDNITKYRFLELPFKRNNVAMLLALSNRKKPTKLWMTPSLFGRITKNLVPTELSRVAIPMFKFNYESNLEEPLQPLCVKDFFTSEAKLENMKSRNDFKGSLFYHKAAIDVNHDGTKASAFTRVNIVSKFQKDSPRKFSDSVATEKNHFVIEHPFYFYIYNVQSGLVLFSGFVADP